MESDRESLSQHFENMVKKIGQLLNENKKEELMIDLLQQEIEDRQIEIAEFRRKQESFDFVEHELNMIQSIITEEEANFLKRRKDERDNIKTVCLQKEKEIEEKRKMLQDAEIEIKELHVRIEENQLKRQALEKKIELKEEKVCKIVQDIENENRALKEINEAVLHRAEDLDVIKEHEQLVMVRDQKANELARLTEKKGLMEDKMEKIKESLGRIEDDLQKARETKQRKTEELQRMRQKQEDMTKHAEDLELELKELETLDSEITFLKYYISKAELKIMEHKRAHRAKQASLTQNSKFKEVQSELMGLPTNTYTSGAKTKIDSSVKTIIEKFRNIGAGV